MNRILVSIVGAVAVALSGCATPGLTAVKQDNSAELQRILDQPNHGGEDLSGLLNESAVFSNCLECARLLLRAGAKPWTSRQGYQDGSGYYILEPGFDGLLAAAAWHGHTQIAQLLIDHGADPAAAMTFVRGWGDGPGAQAASVFLGKVEQVRAAATAHPAAAVVGEAPRPLLTPSFHEVEHPNDYALIVGIEKYTDLPAATYADSDAEAAGAFVRALGVPERNMVTLTGAHATRSGLVKQLEGWLANNVNENSTVYFYYSGHGAPDPATGQAYLVPLDGDPQYLADTAYPLKRLYEKLGALKAKRVIVMLDSCFSGAGGRSVLAKGSRPLVNNVDTGFNSGDGKIAVLAASGADQISGTDDDTGHGLFTQYLLEGLNGAAVNREGQVTLKSLYDYVKPKVMDDAHRANRDQVPQLQTGGAAADVVLRDK
jgi:hypothetical protein